MNAEELRFDAAINPYGCSPKVVESLVAFAQSRRYRFYGDELYSESLRERLSEYFGLPSDRFLVYNGAGEALVWQFLIHLLLPKGRLLVPYPSYERFVALGKRCAVEVIEVPLTDDRFELDVERTIQEAQTHRVAAALISNPNNPTGNRLLDNDSLRTLVSAVPDCMWFVDEAYADYGRKTFTPMTQEFPNLVVLRTFSKAYGLAGLRIGYCVAHPSVARRVGAFQIPWSVDSMALTAAEAALGDQRYLEDVVERIRRDCAAFGESLRGIPYLRVYPTDANFVLARIEGQDPRAVHGRLVEAGIRVRARPDMPAFLRMTSMLPEMNARLVDALSDA